MEVIIRQERLTAEEYIAFLARTDLGAQYPKERFAERVGRLVRHASISLTARRPDGTLIGVLLALTDFAYWMFITDMGVDRACVGQGIGRRLFEAAHEIAGGRRDIIVYTCANSGAVGFYEKMGMRRADDDVMQLSEIDWTPFVVGEAQDGETGGV